MPTTAAPAEILRERARALRRLAHTIDDSEATTLYRRAGIGTWIGPTPQHCVDDLVMARDLLRHAADALRGSAYRLEQRASQMDVAARMTNTPITVNAWATLA